MLKATIEPSATLEGMLEKLKATFGNRVSIDEDTETIRLDESFNYCMVYYDQKDGFVLTEAGSIMLAIAQSEGVDEVNIQRVTKEMN